MNVLLFFVVFLAEIATDIYVPSLPLLSSHFGSPSQTVQLTMSLHLFGFALGQLFYGVLSDRWGCRTTLLAGFSLFVASSLACALSGNMASLICFRFLQGLGACVAPVVALAIFKDLYDTPAANIQMISLMSMVMSCSPILGPILGGIIGEYSGWRANFYLLFFCGLLILPWIRSILSPSYSGIGGTGCRGPLSTPFSRDSLRNFRFFNYLIINALLVSVVWLFITEAPFVLIEGYHVSMTGYSFYQTITVAGYMAGGFFAHRAAIRIVPPKLIKIGIGLSSASAWALLAVVHWGAMTPLTFAGAIAFYEFGLGILRPAVLDTLMGMFPDRKGVSSALIGTLEMLVSGLILLSLSFIGSGSPLSLITFMCSAATLALMLYALEDKLRLLWVS